MNSCKDCEKSEFKGTGRFWQSVKAALEGVVYTFMSERNMRVHFLAAFCVLLLGIYFDLNYVELILLLFAITFVLSAEMINTAIEYLSDTIVKKEFHPLIKLTKDVAAGAVFVAAVNAIITGYILTSNRIALHRGQLFFKIKQSPWHLTFIALLVCVAVVILVKVLRKEKDLLKGGLPSGHTALAFSVWMITWIVSTNSLVSILVFMLAVAIAKSRMITGIHTLWEVFIGGLIGALTTLFIFQVLS